MGRVLNLGPTKDKCCQDIMAPVGSAPLDKKQMNALSQKLDTTVLWNVQNRAVAPKSASDMKMAAAVAEATTAAAGEQVATIS